MVEGRSAEALEAIAQALVAIGLRDMLQDIPTDEDQEALCWWCKRAKLSRLERFRELAGSIQQHRSGVVAFLKPRSLARL